jgi:bifunctional UDP-N-acetylglucosamine pyrophosphorylase / glucosamine-1-phosphate N-acetyltransferase
MLRIMKIKEIVDIIASSIFMRYSDFLLRALFDQLNLFVKMKLNIIILAAGRSVRMKSRVSKIMHELASRPMIDYVLETAKALHPDRTILVTLNEMEEVREHTSAIYKDLAHVMVGQPLGTGHAVRAALDMIAEDNGITLILYADHPLLPAEPLDTIIERLNASEKKAVVVLGFEASNPGHYGRLVVKGEYLKKIVEYCECSEQEKKISLCNSGMMGIKNKYIKGLIAKVDNQNSKKEYFLTDIVEIAKNERLECSHLSALEDDLIGINTRADLARAEEVIQKRLCEKIMDGGATIVDPRSVTFAYDTKIGEDTIIHPHVVFGPEVIINDNVEIHSFSHIAGANVRAGAKVGPFARLRPGTIICEEAKIGNFVEIKKSTVEHGSKINHLSYIGDAYIGQRSNIGAGVITCNYDGIANKYRTIIGEEVAVGSNCSLIAPLKIGDGAMIGAGSVINRDVYSDSLAIARPPQVAIKDKAKDLKRQGHTQKQRSPLEL